MAAPRQRWRQPHHLATEVGDHLHVHPVPTVLGGVVGPAVTEAVALGQGAVQQDELGVRLPQNTQQNRGTGSQQLDDCAGVGVRSADRGQDEEPTRLLRRWVETSNASLNSTGALCVVAKVAVTRSVPSLKDLTVLGPDALAEHPVSPALVDHDDRRGESGTPCHALQGVGARRGVGDRQAPVRVERGRHDVRKASGQHRDRGHDGDAGERERPSLTAGLVREECRAIGYVIGLNLPRLLAVPVALVGSFVWMAYPAAMNVFWVRQLNGTNLAECCTLDQIAAPRSILAPVLVAIGLLLAARLVTIRQWALRILAPVVLAVAVAVSAWIVQPLGYGAAEPRSTALRTCSDTQPRVCLWPEQHDAAKDIVTWATDPHTRLADLGVTTAAELSPRSSTPTSNTVHSLVALSALPKDIPTCAKYGEWPGSRAFGPLSVWLTITAGADSRVVASGYAPAEVEVATRILQRPHRAQLAWFQQNAKTLTRCDLQPVLDPERF
jgi:hypothetical protein